MRLLLRSPFGRSSRGNRSHNRTHSQNSLNKRNDKIHTEYNGTGPNCSDDSLPVSFPPRNNEISSADERFKQLPIMISHRVDCVDFLGCVSVCVSVRVNTSSLVERAECVASLLNFTPTNSVCIHRHRFNRRTLLCADSLKLYVDMFYFFFNAFTELIHSRSKFNLWLFLFRLGHRSPNYEILCLFIRKH